MIKFRDKIYKNFFIDPETAVITNEKGEIQETKIRDGRPYFKGHGLHQWQVHTHIGYEEGYDIHHLDENKLNNSLKNLVYLTRSEHISIHHKGKHNSDEIMKKTQKIIYLNEASIKKIKLYTEKYREATGEFCSMGKFVENLIDKLCQSNLELLIQKHRKDKNDEEELISIIEEETGKIKNKFKIGVN